jgi:hypothetical protein
VRRFALRALFVAILCGFLGFSLEARADPLPIELSWEAPAECPTHDDVMAELARITRVKPGRVVTSIRAQATIEKGSDGRYELRLHTQREDQTGETDLDASSCAALERGVTLVLALALGDGVDVVDEKSAAPDTAPSAPLEAPKPAPPPAPPKAPPAPPAPPREPHAALRWAPWLAAAGSYGLIAKPALGGQIGLELGQTHWQTNARATVWPTGSAAEVQGIDSSFFALVGGLAGCGRVPLDAWTLSACANLEVGAIRGSARGALQNNARTAPWYAAGPSLVLNAPLYGRTKLRVEAGLSVGFDPPHFAIRGLRDVYVVSRFVPAASLGVSF